MHYYANITMIMLAVGFLGALFIIFAGPVE